jgi:hypothetical protein
VETRRITNSACVAGALLAIATVERGPVELAVRCPDPAVAFYGSVFSRFGHSAGVPRHGQAFDVCIPDIRDSSITPTIYLLHSGKHSQQADKK